MAVKNYLINDKWLDIDKQNIVEVKSTDGVIESVKVNGEDYGGGGDSWQAVFGGSVTTTEHKMPGGEIAYTGFIDTANPITSATIKVTFNGVEYTCPFMDNEYYGSPDNEFREYPFTIQPNGLVATQTAGTYTLKIEGRN